MGCNYCLLLRIQRNRHPQGWSGSCSVEMPQHCPSCHWGTVQQNKIFPKSVITGLNTNQRESSWEDAISSLRCCSIAVYHQSQKPAWDIWWAPSCKHAEVKLHSWALRCRLLCAHRPFPVSDQILSCAYPISPQVHGLLLSMQHSACLSRTESANGTGMSPLMPPSIVGPAAHHCPWKATSHSVHQTE